MVCVIINQIFINDNINYLGGRVYAATESSGGSGSWLRIGDRLISYNFTKIHSEH